MIHLEKKNTNLHYDQYVKRGNISLLRKGLPFDDPDNLYNYLKNSPVLFEAKLTPEDFDIYHPIVEKYRGKTEKEYLEIITDLITKNR